MSNLSGHQLPAHIKFDWNKWLQDLVYQSGGLVAQAIALQTSLDDVEQYGPVLGQVNFDYLYVTDVLNIIKLIAAKQLQLHILDLSEKQYIITSVHDHSFCGIQIDHSKETRAGGVVILRCPRVTLITTYDYPAQLWNVVPYIEDAHKDINTL